MSESIRRSKLNLSLFLERAFPYLMVTPTIIVVCTLIIYPILTGISLSFYNYVLVSSEKPFIGLKNYSEILSDLRFHRILFNTVIFALLSVAISTLIGLGSALFLNKSGKLTGTFRSIGYLPWITPSVVFVYVWVWAFSKHFSPFNALLVNIHLLDSPIAFLGNLDIKFLGLSLPFWSVLFVRVWASFPFKTTTLLAALQNIPQERYDAAYVDGANRFQQFWYIVLPGIMPVMFIVVSMSTIWNLNHFDINYLMTSGGPQDTTNVLPIFIYNRAFIHYRMGLASAAGIIVLLVASVVGVIYLKYVSKGEER